MVSADNLHLDVLIDIFSFLSPSDLASTSLVSKSFSAGAIKQLYCAIHFRASNLKRWPAVSKGYDVFNDVSLTFAIQQADPLNR